MSTGQMILGILGFALVTAILYVWGLRRSMTQSADLERILLSKSAGKVVHYLKVHRIKLVLFVLLLQLIFLFWFLLLLLLSVS